MKLIVGLGNPTEQYAKTRHNIGFMALDYYLKDKNLTPTQKFKGILYKGPDVMYLKPQTFMNLSGESVGEAMRYFSIANEDVLVIYDDLDLPPGACRIRRRGSAGGHKGLQSIIDVVGLKKFPDCASALEKEKTQKRMCSRKSPKKTKKYLTKPLKM